MKTNFDAKYQEKKQLLALVSGCAVVSLLPLILFASDLWDGTIVSYAFESDNVEIFNTWFKEVGSPLGSLLYTIAYYIFGDAFVNHKILLNSTMFFLIIVCAVQIYYIGKGIFGFGHEAALMAALTYIFNPSWHILVSSVFFSLVFWNFFAITAINLVLLSKRKVLRLIGVLLLCVSFHYAANPALVLPILLFCYLGLGVRKRDYYGLFIILIGIFYFVLFRYNFPASEIYAGYNQMTSVHLLDLDLYFRFFDFFIRNYWPVLPLILICAFKVRDFKFFLTLVFMIAVLVSTVIPFVTVNKVVTSPFDWTNRVTVNLTIATCFLVGITVHYCNISKAKLLQRVLIVSMFMVIIHNLYAGYSHKIKALIYQDYFVATLSSMEKPRPGLIYTKNLSFYTPDSYEYNYYFYHAFKQASWFVNIGDDVSNAILMTKSADYRDKYIASDFEHQCTYNMHTSTNLQNVSIWQSWVYFFNKEYFLSKYSGYYLNIDLRKVRCESSDFIDHVIPDSELVNIKSLRAGDVEKCNSFTFSSSIWSVEEPIVFPVDCTVVFSEGAELEFLENTYLVIQGKVFFSTNGVVKFYGRAKGLADGEKWGGVLIKSDQAHVQYVEMHGATGFYYDGHYFPGALNFSDNVSSSVYRSSFYKSATAVFVDSNPTRIHQSLFDKNVVSIFLKEASSKVVNNVFVASSEASLLVAGNSKPMVIRNMFMDSDVAVKLGTLSSLDSYYNLFYSNDLSVRMLRLSTIFSEYDAYAYNNRNIQGEFPEVDGFDGDAFVSGGIKASIELQNQYPSVSELLVFDEWISNNFKECEPCSDYIPVIISRGESER